MSVTLAQLTARAVPHLSSRADWWSAFHHVYEFLAPYNEYLLVLFILWLFARRGRPVQGDFSRQAQDVLDVKYREGEIGRRTYEKYRQDVGIRLRR